MTRKKGIKAHIFWGGIFGLISGIIAGYAGAFFRSVPQSFPINIEQYLIFLTPGLFLGLALGIADKSMKKCLYGAIGGLIAGMVFYLLFHVFKQHAPESVVGPIVLFGGPLAPVIYIIFISLAFGIMNKSFYRALRVIIGGSIALLIAYPLTFFLFWMYVLCLGAMGGDPELRPTMATLLALYAFLGVVVILGMCLGDKKGEKALNENS